MSLVSGLTLVLCLVCDYPDYVQPCLFFHLPQITFMCMYNLVFPFILTVCFSSACTCFRGCCNLGLWCQPQWKVLFFFVYYNLFLSPAFKSFNLQIMTGISHVGLRELSGYNVIALFFNTLNLLKSDCNTSRINFNVWQAVREISLIIASSHSQRAAWAHV